MWRSSTVASSSSHMSIFQSGKGYGLLLTLALYIGVAFLILSHVTEARLGKGITTVQVDDMIFETRRNSKLVEGGAAYAEVASWPLDTTTGKYDVVYDFSSAPPYLFHRLHYVMRMLELGSNLKFRPRRPDEEAYIKLELTEGLCASIIGYTGGPQKLQIAPFCAAPGSLTHELFHALGFAHEHSRSDRMHYVKVNKTLENDVNFFVANTTNYTPYEYYSIMHYGMWSGTITSLDPNARGSVRRAFPSVCDWHSLNKRYDGAVKAPKCVLNQFDDMVPSLAYRTVEDQQDPNEICKSNGDFRFFNRQCRIRGGLEYPSMPWANEVKTLKSDAISRPARRDFCRGFQDLQNRDKTIFCRRACNIGCPAQYSEMTLERCMATVYPGCKQHKSRKLS